jgi:hypothetical protein
MVRRVVGRGGYEPGFVLEDAEMATIGQPTLMVYGSADPVGSVDIWRRFGSPAGFRGASWRWWTEAGTWSGTTIPPGSALASRSSWPAETGPP